MEESEKILITNLLDYDLKKQKEIELNIHKKYIKTLKIILQKIDIFIEHVMAKERELKDVEILQLFKEDLFKKDELIELIEDIDSVKNDELINKVIYNEMILKEYV